MHLTGCPGHDRVPWADLKPLRQLGAGLDERHLDVLARDAPPIFAAVLDRRSATAGRQFVGVGPNAVRLTPYPFDCSPLPIAVAGRVMAPEPSVSAAEGREAYYRATRTVLSWELVG